MHWLIPPRIMINYGQNCLHFEKKGCLFLTTRFSGEPTFTGPMMKPEKLNFSRKNVNYRLLKACKQYYLKHIKNTFILKIYIGTQVNYWFENRKMNFETL